MWYGGLFLYLRSTIPPHTESAGRGGVCYNANDYMLFNSLKNNTHSERLATWIMKHGWKTLLYIPVTALFGPILSLPLLGRQYEITAPEIIIGVSIVVIGCLWASRQRPEGFRITHTGGALLLILGWMIVSGLWVESFDKYAIALRVILYQIATFFLVLNCFKTKRHVYAGLWSLTILGVGAAIMTIVTIIDIPFRQLFVANRALIIMPMGALSYVAAIIAMLIPLILFLTTIEKKLARVWFLRAVYVLALVALLYAAGKAAILSTVIGVGVYLIIVKKQRFPTILGTVLALGIFIALADREVATHTFERFQDIAIDSSTSFRTLELAAARDIFINHWLIGTGAGNLKVAYKAITGFYEGEANNIIVQFGAELGVIGLGLFSFLIAQGIRWFRQATSLLNPHRTATLATLPFFITVGINAMFEVTIVGLLYGILFWYILALFYRYAEIEEKN